MGNPNREVCDLKKYKCRILLTIIQCEKKRDVEMSHGVMYDSNKGRYYIILGIDLLIILGLQLNLYERVMVGGKGSDEGCSAPMVGIGNYYYAPLTDKIIKPEE